MVGSSRSPCDRTSISSQCAAMSSGTPCGPTWWGAAEDRRWGSLGDARTKDDADRPALTPWPIDRPRDWTDRVNRPFGPKEEEAVRRSIPRGRPYGLPSWQAAVSKRLRLESVFGPRGRPRKEPQNGSLPPTLPPTIASAAGVTASEQLNSYRSQATRRQCRPCERCNFAAIPASLRHSSIDVGHYRINLGKAS